MYYVSYRVLIIVIIIVILVLFLGILGYHYILKQDWAESFYLATLTMTSLSLEIKPQEMGEKIFIAFITLVSVGLYLILIATIIACFLEPALKKNLYPPGEPLGIF